MRPLWPRVKRRVTRAVLRLAPSLDAFPSIFIWPAHEWPQRQWAQLRHGYDEEEVAKGFIRRVLPYTIVTYRGLVSLVDITRYVVREKVPGAFVETGCFEGGAAALMAMAILHEGKEQDRRSLHLFDSFQGLPQPSQSDREEWMLRDWHLTDADFTGKLVTTGSMVADIANVERVVHTIAGYPRELVTIHPGWFQDTVPLAAQHVGPIALLRLDGDLYESTMVCLEHLYPLVVPGGFVVVDDYGLKGCRAAVTEYLARQGHAPYLHVVDGIVRYFQKP